LRCVVWTRSGSSGKASVAANPAHPPSGGPAGRLTDERGPRPDILYAPQRPRVSGNRPAGPHSPPTPYGSAMTSPITGVNREELAQAIARASLLRGTFTLRSGRTSSYYLDKYRFSTRPEILRPLAALFAERIGAIAASCGGVERL